MSIVRGSFVLAIAVSLAACGSEDENRVRDGGKLRADRVRLRERALRVPLSFPTKRSEPTVAAAESLPLPAVNATDAAGEASEALRFRPAR
jgi:hypothetical protein